MNTKNDGEQKREKMCNDPANNGAIITSVGTRQPDRNPANSLSWIPLHLAVCG